MFKFYPKKQQIIPKTENNEVISILAIRKEKQRIVIGTSAEQAMRGKTVFLTKPYTTI